MKLRNLWRQLCWFAVERKKEILLKIWTKTNKGKNWLIQATGRFNSIVWPRVTSWACLTAVMFVVELVSDQDVDHRVQVVKKRQEVEGHLGPSFVHCKVEWVAIHDCCWIVKPRLKNFRRCKKKLRIPWSFPLGVCCIARRGKQSFSVSKFCPEIGFGD